MKNLKLIAIITSCSLSIQAQTLTSEDSMSISGKSSATFIGGYGNAFYQFNSNEGKSKVNLERVVIFLGHRFNEKFSLLTEIEIEDAKIEGGEEGGELAIEQAYLKFFTNRNSYLTAGLFLPRIGILNENHLPNTFNGNERTRIEKYIIPSTWRELGVAFYSQLNNVPIDISVALMSGLNSSEFHHGTLIRGGRSSGRQSPANNLALTSALQYRRNNLTFQVSAYAGGSVGFSSIEADSLNLDSGPFGTPVMLAEANVVYRKNAVTFKALATIVSIKDAEKINASFANNTPESAYGFFVEAAYDILHNRKSEVKKSLYGFMRFEKFDLNATIPSNGIIDPVLDQQHIIAGFNYMPIPQISVKADVRFQTTGDINTALNPNPNPATPPFENNNTYINLGFGYSF